MNNFASIMDPTERIIFSLRALYLSYGYRRYRMDKFEDYDLYGKNRDFLISDRLITFTDGTGRLKALKPDVTLSVLRNSRSRKDGVEKYCYNESVYRMGPDGTFREIPQSGIECIGDVDEACVAEVLLLAARSLAALSADYVLSLSELTVLFALVSAVSSDEREEALLRRAAARRALGEIDEIAAANGKTAEAGALKALLTLPAEPKAAMDILQGLPLFGAARQAAERFARLLQGLAAAGLRAEPDFTIAGDASYYNGIVFKGFLKTVPDSVLSGGQYGGLMRSMGLEGEAAGFAVYLDRLQEAGGAA